MLAPRCLEHSVLASDGPEFWVRGGKVVATSEMTIVVSSARLHGGAREV